MKAATTKHVTTLLLAGLFATACNALLGQQESTELLECIVDGDCGGDQRCSDGECVGESAAENDDASVPGGERGGGTECARNLDCDPGEVCLDGRCEDDDARDDDIVDGNGEPDASIDDDSDDDTPPEGDDDVLDDDTVPDCEGADCECVEGDTQPCSGPGLRGSCAAGVEECAADGQWGECSIQPLAGDTCEPGNDDNCNGSVNDGCPCDEGAERPCSEGAYFGPCAEGTQSCEAGAFSGCDIAPANADTCVPGDDSNCNGQENEGCLCLEGASQTCAESGLVGACAEGEQTCDEAGEWSACSVEATELDGCDPGNDDNCDGVVKEGCPCEDGEERDCSEGGLAGPCAGGTQVCVDDVWGECSIARGASDTCELDNDDNCNGIANELCECADGATQLCSEGGLFGKCASGQQTCSDGEWGACSIQPELMDTCNPGNDDDCDGNQNEGCTCDQGDTRGCAAGGYSGPCTSGTQVCLSDGTWGACSFPPEPYDTCAADNDADCDGIANSPLDPACDCVGGASRSCSLGGLLGPCANGTQTCSSQGQWNACSIAPAAADTCTADNDASCNGVPNEGCDCLVGEAECVAATPSTQRQACTSGGTWGNPTSCQFVCTGAGLCGGSCSPSVRECSGNTPRACQVNGEWQNEAACGPTMPCQGAGVCQACATGYASGGQCVPWSNCTAGDYIANAGTSTTDRQCSPCAAGTYSAGVNATNCTTCGAGTYSGAGATSCTGWTTCNAGQYVSTAGSTTANQQCSACATGYTTQPNQPSCTAWTTCNAGQYVSSAGTPTADRQCTGCTSGTFSTTPNASSCTAWTVCGSGFVEGTPGSATSDRTCVEDAQPNCQGLASNCGSAGTDSCCTTLLVTGGDFNRINNASYPATVANFNLDKYEVTVGRFRKFKTAWGGGWRPTSGSGKHTHLNSGSGLVNTTGTPTNESGWDTAWNTSVAPTDGNLACSGPYDTWTTSTGANETRPINCVNWYESYAFCIWDGGFLPSEAEWNYAAAGGNAQRTYPWGSTVPGADANLAVYGCYYGGGGGSCTGVANIAPVGSVPAGNGLYLQSDLGGNVWEWNLDWYTAPLPVSCNNCAYLPASASSGAVRGGSFGGDASSLLSSDRGNDAPGFRSSTYGLRCARSAP